MRPQPYPKYKPSGVEWLREVPEHWDVKAIKWESPVLRGASPRPIDNDIYFDEKGDYAWVRIADVSAAGMYLHETVQRLSNLGRSLSVSLQPGTLFLSIAGTVGKPCITAIKCCIHDGFVYFPFWCGESRFLYYLFASGESYRGLGKFGTQLNLNTDTVGSIIAGFPESLEQRAIADFLDRETAKIDILVAKKRTLIDRLKEKRTALISRTVTRGLPPDAARATGLDPHPKLKPTGIDWLGEVPGYWEVKPLGRLVRFAGGATPDKGKPEYWDGDIPWVSPKDMKRMRIDDVPNHVSREGLSSSALTLMPAQSVLIVVRGMILAHSFPVAITDAPVTINQDMKALTSGKRLNAEFLLWLLTGIAGIFVSLADESAHGTRRLESEIVARVRVALPSTDEQISIVDFLDRETAKIDALIAKIETAIERLQEHRTALIIAAVTGKIDVRGTVVREEDAA